MDPRANVRPGERLQIAASQINFLNSQMAADTSFRAGPLEGWRFGGNVILARNDTGSAVPRWGVMKAGGIVIDPNDGDGPRREFEAMPCLIGSDASSADHISKAIVAIEPIAPNAIGKVAVAGVVQIKSVDLVKVGAALELWKYGEWSVIRFGDAAVRLGKTTAAWLRGTSQQIELWGEGDPPDEEISSPLTTITAWNKFYDVAACVWVLVSQHPSGQWYLVEAATPDPSESGCRAPNIGGHDLTTVSGYASNKKQALTHDQNACLKWVDIEDCA